MEFRTKILFVGWESDRTGPAGDLLRLLPRLPEDRFGATIVFRHEAGPLALDLQHAGAMVLDLGAPGAERAKGFLATTGAIHRLTRIMRELAPAVAHGLDEPSSALVAIAGRMAGVPVLIGSSRGQPPARLPRINRMALRRLDRFTAAGESARAAWSAFFGDDRPRVTPLVFGIDPAEVRGALRAPEFSEPRPRLGTMVRLDGGCGFADLIGAAARLRKGLPDLEWLVLGVGPEAVRWLRVTQGEGLGDCMRLLGDREDVGGFLASIDAYVAAESSDAHPSGLLQALAAGVPSVAVVNPGLAAAFADGRDLLFVPAGDPDGLAAAAGRLLADGEGALRERLRAAGPLAVRDFRSEATASDLVDLYESLMSERRR